MPLVPLPIERLRAVRPAPIRSIGVTEQSWNARPKRPLAEPTTRLSSRHSTNCRLALANVELHMRLFAREVEFSTIKTPHTPIEAVQGAGWELPDRDERLDLALPLAIELQPQYGLPGILGSRRRGTEDHANRYDERRHKAATRPVRATVRAARRIRTDGEMADGGSAGKNETRYRSG